MSGTTTAGPVQAKQRLFGIISVALGVLMFGGGIALRHRIDPWWTNAAAGLVGLATAALALRGERRALLVARYSTAIAAAALGLVMVLCTHLAFRQIAQHAPALQSAVTLLYEDLHGEASPSPAIAVPLVIMIVTAEELVWRGVAIGLCREWLAPAGAVAAAVALYVAPQLIGGSWVLIAAATVVGMVFTLQRVLTDRLIDPIITHSVWSVGVFVLFPLV